MLRSYKLSKYTIAELKVWRDILGIKTKCSRKDDYITALTTRSALDIFNVFEDIPSDYIQRFCSRYDYTNPFRNNASIPIFKILEFLYEIDDTNFKPLGLLIRLQHALQLSTDDDIDSKLAVEYLTNNDIVEIYTRNQFNINFDAIDEPVSLMNQSGYKKIKSQNVAILKMKEIFGVQLSAKEEMENKFNTFFESNDLSYVQQGLSLLESLYSIEDICTFFGFDFSTVFESGHTINDNKKYRDDDPKLVEILIRRYSNPAVIGHLYLWLIGLVYSERPECVTFTNNQLSFFFGDSHRKLSICYNDGYVPSNASKNRKRSPMGYSFSSIPESLFPIASIESLVLPQELEAVPGKFFCMPNLRNLAIIGCSSEIHCPDPEHLQNSKIELLIIEEMEVIPDFIWKLPKLKQIMIRKFKGRFNPPFNTSIEELKLSFEREGTVSSIENLTNLQTLKINSGSTFEVSSPSIQHLTINNFNTVTLGEMSNLRHLEVVFPERGEQLLTIDSIPNIEEFYVDGYYREGYRNTNLDTSLLKASNATNVTFSSLAPEIPAELTTWPNLKRLNITNWNSLTTFPIDFRDWNIPEIVCLYPQIAFNNFPENVQTLYVGCHTKPNRTLVGLKRLKNLKQLTFRRPSWSIDPYLEEIFQCSTLHFLDLSRCYISQLPSSIKELSNLLALELQDNENLQKLSDDIGSLTKLRYLNLAKTAIRTFPASIAQCTELQRVQFSELTDPLLHRSILGRPYLRQGQIFYGPNAPGFSLETRLRAFFRYAKDYPDFAQQVEVLHIDPRAIKQPSRRYAMFTSEGLNDPNVFMYPDIDFSLLPNLKHLNICRIEGDFPHLPASIQKLEYLESIDISHNLSLHVPDWLFSLPSLKEVFAYGVISFTEHERYLSMAKDNGVTLHVQAYSGL